MNARTKTTDRKRLAAILAAHRRAEEAHEEHLMARRRARAAEQALRDLLDGESNP